MVSTSTVSKTEEQDVIDRLERYEQRFDELLALITNIAQRATRRAEAQELLKQLKEDLRRDYRAGDTVKARERMTEVELCYLHPAIHQASTDIHVRWNSIPNEKWISELYAARGNITYMLDELKR